MLARLNPRSCLLMIAVVLWLGGALTFPYFYTRRYGVTQDQLIEEVKRANRMVAATIGAPPKAERYETPEETAYTHRSSITVARAETFEMPGSFADLVDWYAAVLESQGWRPWDRANWAEFYVDFCLAPRTLRLERTADYPEGRSPYHRFTVRLEWHNRMEPERCLNQP